MMKLVIDELSHLKQTEFNIFIVGKFSFTLQTATTTSTLPPGRVWWDRSDVLWKHKTKSDTGWSCRFQKHQWCSIDKVIYRCVRSSCRIEPELWEQTELQDQESLSWKNKHYHIYKNETIKTCFTNVRLNTRPGTEDSQI